MKELEVLCFGEVLWDNLKDGRKLGGAPLNVCYHLTKMGIGSRIITQIGNDPDGRAILKELNHLGINVDTCWISDSKATSTVEVHLGENDEVTYEILQDVAWDHILYTPELGTLVRGAKALVFGSLVARSKTSRDTLFRLIRKSDFRVFDVNLRRPFYSKELIISLLQYTDLLKLNQEELYKISQWLRETRNDKQDGIGIIQKKFPNIKEILLTRGHKGAVYIRGNETIKIPAYEVRVKDTVGSGDSFLAAFIAQKLNNKSVASALQQASFLSAFIASNNGACPDYNMKDLEKFKESFQIDLKE